MRCSSRREAYDARPDALGPGVADVAARVSLAIVSWMVRHLLLIIALAMALYVALPLLAPWLLYRGHQGGSQAIYTLFRPLCHQLPERSFFLFGEQSTYSARELVTSLGGAVPARFVGNPVLGYKVAVCQRDVAIYGSMLLALATLGPIARRLRAWPAWVLALTAAPMAVDGLGQLVGLWQSSPWSRVLTGALFGLGLVRWGLPHLSRALASAQEIGMEP